LRRWVAIFLSRVQKVARVEGSTEVPRIPREWEENHFEGITTGNGSWFQYSYPSSKMFAQPPTDVIPKTRQTMITIFFTRRPQIVLDILKKETNSTSSVLSILFFRLKRENVNFHPRAMQAASGSVWAIQ
jgi:hypothetical protein